MSFSPRKFREPAAVAFSLAYTFLIARSSAWAWPCALAASLLFMRLVWEKKLLAESALHFFYLITAVYGWIYFEKSEGTPGEHLPVPMHMVLVGGATLITALAGYYLKKSRRAALPYLDSATTVFSILATLLMVRLIPENWLYWIVIDAVSAILYFKRGLFISAGMFLVYTALSAYGYWSWTAGG